MNSPTAAGAMPSSAQESMEEKRRNAIKGAFFSEFVGMFDTYLLVNVPP